MDDQKQLFLFAQPLPGNDQCLVERIKEAANTRNRYGAATTYALVDIEASNISQLVAGPGHVAFLFKNGQVARLGYQLTVSKEESASNDDKPSSGAGGLGGSSSSCGGAGGTNTSGTSSGSGSSSTVAALNRTAKIRRVMLATRRSAALGERAGVIVDRTRPLVPVSAIPEDLIAQAQVVLQGKSRDVIVRELQRTNLNVNEAVNNLLSRDDEEGDEMDDGSESYLPEELLSLLDAGLRSDARGTAVIDHDAFYAATGEGFDYVVARDIARRRADRGEKKSEKTKESLGGGTNTKIKIGDRLQYWGKEADPFPTGVTKFTKIVAMHSELVALADNGFIYGWAWDNTGNGSMTVHPFGRMILANAPNEEKFVDIAACAYRACVLTSSNRVASFLDCGACGVRVSTQLVMPLSDIPDGEKAVAMYVCPMFSLIKTHTNSFYWWGIYPFNERRKLWERVRSRSRRHVTFDVNEITEGCEVRTKSHPIYTAGSIAVSFVSGAPMIGTLMESAWTLAELCRFRVQTPAQYDSSAGEGSEGACSQTDKKSALNQNGKRPRDENTTPNFREAAWALNDVIFIHEESSQDTAIVKIVDGAYCGIVYKSAAARDIKAPKAPTSSGGMEQSEDSQQQQELDLAKIRLMRKDDLVVISPTSKTPRSPENFQNQLQKVPLPAWLSVRKLHSVTVDNTGLRILVEKRGRVHLVRVSVFGKLLTDHLLPMNSSALYGVAQCAPQLDNYGDESLVVIRDGNGSVVPMCRDAVGGFREPVYFGMPPIHRFAIGLRPPEHSAETGGGGASSSGGSSSRQVTRTAVFVTLVAPSPSSTHPRIPSLMQTVLYCDAKGVEAVLDALKKESVDTIAAEVAHSRCDGNRNILHAAVMNAFSSTNRDDEDTVDVPVDFDRKTTPQQPRVEMTAAEQTRASYDQRWQRILRRRGAEAAGEELFLRELMNPMRRAGHEVSNVEDVLADIAKSFEDNKKAALFFEDVKDCSMPILVSPVAEPKQRQLNAIEIVKTLCRHSTTSPHLYDLLSTRDINGHTPFMCAINMRAYSAACVIWMAIEILQRDAGTTVVPGKKQTPEAIVNAAIFPAGSKPDDSPLFVLCVNDTCSFTWTGDEHINQDIFECKTCGLVGTLCCCTECAFTCHRNHDCKLKRTSPTAYCDCWEKCSCKALVSGNTVRREKLLETMLHCTHLINQVDSRGEHLMLFLARTVGRQLVEQEHYQRRASSNKPKSQASSDGVTPEHDLEPPKFARTAFMKLLTDWQSVKSLIMLGVKWPQKDVLVIEEVFHLNQQSGTSHLDKFVFTLLAKCTEAHMDSLLNTLIAESNKKDSGSDKRDPDVDFIIARFIRSVIRLFTLITVLSPVAAGVAAAASSGALLAPVVNNGAPPRRSLGSGFHAVSFSGLLSLVRTSSGRDSSASKEAKKKSVTNFVLKCRRVFQTLISYSVNELCNMADALIAPVRRGILKPTAFIQQNNSSADCLEMVERYLAGEVDLSSLSTSRLDEVSSTKTAPKRRRQSSRRDTDRAGEEESQNSASGTLSALINVVDSDNSSDSESDDVASVRHPVSQGSVTDVGDAVDDEQRPKRYRLVGSSYDDEELLSMSGDDGDDESMDSVSTPPDRDDEPNSQDNETNADDDDGGDDGDSEAIVEYTGDERRGRREEDEGDRSYGDEDIYDVADEDEHYEREEEGEEGEGEGNDEREGNGNGDEERERDDEGSESTFSESNREADDPYAFRVSTRNRRRTGEERHAITAGAGQNRSTQGSANADRSVERDDNVDSASGAHARTDAHEGTRQETGGGAGSHPERSADDRNGHPDEANTIRSAEDEEVSNVTTSAEGVAHERRGGPPMRVLFSSEEDAASSRSSALSRSAGVRSARRNATFEEDGPPPPPPPPPSAGDGSARTSGVTSGRNNTVPLTWAVRRISSSSRRESARNRDADRDGDNSDENDRFTDSQSNGRNSSQHLRDAAAGEEDTHSSVNKTSQQLAMSFSVITRLIVDLMPMLVDHREYSKSSYSHIPKMLELSDSIVAALRREIEERLCPTWRWMESVLDRTEAQLRFGNALMWSPAGALIVSNERKSTSRKDEERRRCRRPGSAIYSPVSRPEYTTAAHCSSGGRDSGSKKSEDENHEAVSRSDFFGYVLSLMRSSAGENGDDVPIIEFNALKALAFIADAYLSFVDMVEKVDSILAQGNTDQCTAGTPPQFIDMFDDEQMDSDNRTSPNVTTVRHFFQRSNSLLYPGITAAANHHAFEHRCCDSLALAERPQILKPGVEKEQMFGLPIEQRSTQDHEQSAREHGAQYPAHQGLAAPWTTFKDFMPPTSAVKSETREAVAPGRPNVIVHAKSVSGETTGAVPHKTRRRTSSCASAAPSIPPPRGFAPIKLESLMSALHEKNQSRLHRSLARWKHTLNLMAKAYHEQLMNGCGEESASSVLLTEMAGFSIREAQFRKRMEKFKAAQTKDLIFEVERDKQELIAQTIRQLNMHYSRRTANNNSNGSQSNTSSGSLSAGRESGIVGRGGVRLVNLGSFWNGSSLQGATTAECNNPPLACHKVKVTFKDEPGEGTGVARSFYSAVADAFLTMQSLPDEHHVLTAFGTASSSESTPQPSSRGPWTRSTMRERSAVLLGNLTISSRRRGLRNRYTLSVNSQPYFSLQQPQLNETPADGADVGRHVASNVDGLAPLARWEPDRETLGERLLARVRAIRPALCNKITGMLLDLQPHQLITILASEDLLRSHVEEAAEMLMAAGLGNNSRPGDAAASASSGDQSDPASAAESFIAKAASTPNLQGISTSSSADDDTAPLFYRASKGGYYTPIAGKNTPHRLNAFRNVGRMIGICLMQMEIFPLHVCRHVLKFILGRPINWFDLAFYDPVLFESMRTLVFDDGPLRPDQINDLLLTFEVSLPIEEGGGMVELKRGGSKMAVTHENVVEYIYRFVEARMLGNHLKCLEAIKQGVYDVIRAGSLANMTSEDLRLLLCGTQEVSMTLMQSYTTFTDESSAAPDVLQRFKGWFWSVCSKFSGQEKQDLIFFWTGSPSLPSSEEGFQPLPTVLVRPADDQHLPTANTCISRLYLPLYSSKKVLRAKLLLAIKAKNFGFV